MNLMNSDTIKLLEAKVAQGSRVMSRQYRWGRGQTLVEYSLILFLTTLVVVAVMVAISGNVSLMFEKIRTAVLNVNTE